MAENQSAVRSAGAADVPAIARLLHDFNTEFDEPTPDVATLAGRVRRLLEAGEATVLLAGDGPDGIALFRLRPGLWAEGLECYLQELYVVPALRGRGIGRALLRATIERAREAGAAGVDLNTGETDTAARGLYESMGFTNREGSPDGPSMLFYELEFEL
ncbi:MAG TPA: GNAT family N-acetyltransferase [Solirubrobacterales bacterium]|nr:GNAT family N-acetyltransferase [Solirubrobacterales bacterium]